MVENADILERVERSLDTMRPYLKKDGGNVEVLELTEENILKVRLVGACETCPQSYFTMKAGIEEAVKKAVPEIHSVVAVNMTKPNL
ncbi:MAG: NifU family protein [Chitinophagaceae bacterium]|nr:MAG: NifU family protein [Chitinophagaceae bacterium]